MSLTIAHKTKMRGVVIGESCYVCGRRYHRERLWQYKDRHRKAIEERSQRLKDFVTK